MDLTEAEDIKKRWQEYAEGLLHCRQILYHFSHQGSPCILNVKEESPE